MPFQPGQSGNPAGRPRGARNKTTVLVESLLEGNGEDLICQYIEQAKAGNIRALGHLMGMILPKRKGAPIVMDLPPLEKASDAPGAIAEIISAVCRGELTPEEGILLTRMVEAFLRAKQNAEKLGRKLERAAHVAAAKMREAAEAHVSRPDEAPSPMRARVQADAPMQAGEPAVHSPAAEASQALLAGLAGRSLPRLRQEVLRNTSALADGATCRASIVSPLLIPRVPPAACADTRAAALAHATPRASQVIGPQIPTCESALYSHCSSVLVARPAEARCTARFAHSTVFTLAHTSSGVPEFVAKSDR